MKSTTFERCSCSDCLYSPKIQQNGEILPIMDPLLYINDLPPRNKRMVEKLIKARVIYNNVREQIISGGNFDKNNKELRRKHQQLQNGDSQDKEAIRFLIDLIDKGKITKRPNLSPYLEPKTKISDCCTCCICQSKQNLHKRRTTRKHEPFDSNEIQIKQKLSDRFKKPKPILYSPRPIKSDPCKCTFNLSNIHKKNKSKKPREGSHLQKNGKIKAQLVICKCKDLSKKTIEKVKSVKGKIRDNVKESASKIESSFKKIRNSTDILREKMSPKKKYECEYGSCIPEECDYLDCYEKIKLREKIQNIASKMAVKAYPKINSLNLHKHSHREWKPKTTTDTHPRFEKFKTAKSKLQGSIEDTISKVETSFKNTKNSIDVMRKRMRKKNKYEYDPELYIPDDRYKRKNIRDRVHDFASHVTLKANHRKMGRLSQYVSKEPQTKSKLVESKPKTKYASSLIAEINDRKSTRVMISVSPTNFKRNRNFQKNRRNFPRECLPSMCIPFDCNPAKCAKILLSRANSLHSNISKTNIHRGVKIRNRRTDSSELPKKQRRNDYMTGVGTMIKKVNFKNDNEKNLTLKRCFCSRKIAEKVERLKQVNSNLHKSKYFKRGYKHSNIHLPPNKTRVWVQHKNYKETRNLPVGRNQASNQTIASNIHEGTTMPMKAKQSQSLIGFDGGTKKVRSGQSTKHSPRKQEKHLMWKSGKKIKTDSNHLISISSKVNLNIDFGGNSSSTSWTNNQQDNTKSVRKLLRPPFLEKIKHNKKINRNREIQLSKEKLPHTPKKKLKTFSCQCENMKIKKSNKSPLANKLSYNSIEDESPLMSTGTSKANIKSHMPENNKQVSFRHNETFKSVVGNGMIVEIDSSITSLIKFYSEDHRRHGRKKGYHKSVANTSEEQHTAAPTSQISDHSHPHLQTKKVNTSMKKKHYMHKIYCKNYGTDTPACMKSVSSGTHLKPIKIKTQKVQSHLMKSESSNTYKNLIKVKSEKVQTDLEQPLYVDDYEISPSISRQTIRISSNIHFGIEINSDICDPVNVVMNHNEKVFVNNNDITRNTTKQVYFTTEKIYKNIVVQSYHTLKHGGSTLNIPLKEKLLNTKSFEKDLHSKNTTYKLYAMQSESSKSLQHSNNKKECPYLCCKDLHAQDLTFEYIPNDMIFQKNLTDNQIYHDREYQISYMLNKKFERKIARNRNYRQNKITMTSSTIFGWKPNYRDSYKCVSKRKPELASRDYYRWNWLGNGSNPMFREFKAMIFSSQIFKRLKSRKSELSICTKSKHADLLDEVIILMPYIKKKFQRNISKICLVDKCYGTSNHFNISENKLDQRKGHHKRGGKALLKKSKGHTNFPSKKKQKYRDIPIFLIKQVLDLGKKK